MTAAGNWGEFLTAYDEYLDGKRTYDELPRIDGLQPLKMTEAACMIGDCHKRFTRKPRPGYVAGSWMLPIMCPECTEIAKSGKWQPLPRARIVRR